MLYTARDKNAPYILKLRRLGDDAFIQAARRAHAPSNGMSHRKTIWLQTECPGQRRDGNERNG